MQDHGARQHHRFGGSGMAGIMLCPGRWNMSRAVPEQPSGPAAIRGTLTHELLDYCLDNKLRDATFGAVCAPHDDHDEDLIANVQFALDHIYDIVDSYEDAQLFTEIEFVLDSVADDDVGGYCDVAIFVPSLNLLYILDYKNGVVRVEVGDNKQLLFYATGACQTKFVGIVDTVVCQIIQPNAFHKDGPVRTHVVSHDRIVQYADEVDNAILAAKQPDAPLVPGEYQCEWCPARAFCPAYEAAALKAVATTFATVRHVHPNAMPIVADLSPERIAEILRNAKMLHDWLDDVEKAAYGMLMQGQYVPGFKLVEAQARRKWFGDPKDVATMLAMLTGEDEDVVFPRKLMTITGAEALLKKRYMQGLTKKADKDKVMTQVNATLATLTDKGSSGNLTMAPDSDKRQAVDARSTSVTFGAVNVLPPPSTR